MKPVKYLVGSEDSGQFELERRGYLTAGEKAFVQQVRQSDDSSVKLIALARRIAVKCGIDPQTAYEAVLASAGGEVRDAKLVKRIETEFGDEIADVFNSLALNQSRDDMVIATCMMMYRHDPEWSAKDTVELHPDIITDIVKLYKLEEERSTEGISDELSEEVSIDNIEKKSETTAEDS